jgi:heme-degrading monooxygenase HmoA
MHSIIWKFTIEQTNKKEFETHYGPNGSWAELFRKSPAYIGMMLLRDTSNTSVYLTIDMWQSEKDFEEFKRMYHDEYAALDTKMQRLTIKEELVGRYEAADASMNY